MAKYLAQIKIMLRKDILDVQGKTVENALSTIGFMGMSNVRIGKFVELHIEEENREKAHSLVNDACSQLIANPIIEDFEVRISEI